MCECVRPCRPNRPGRRARRTRHPDRREVRLRGYREALLGCVLSDAVLPRLETIEDAGLAGDRLAHGVLVDARDVGLERKPGPADDRVTGRGGEDLAGLLAAEIADLLADEGRVFPRRVGGGEKALVVL